MSSSSSYRSSKQRYSDSDDETSNSRFSVKPRDSHKANEGRYRETERDREKERDRVRGNERFNRDETRGSHEQFGRNHRSPIKSDRHRRAEGDRRRDDHRDRDRGDRRDRRRDRSRSRSPDSQRSRGSSRKSQTPKAVTEDAKLFDRILDPNYKKKNDTVLEVEDVEMSPVELKEEEEIATFTFEDDCGPSRPSKVASEPASSHYDAESEPQTPKTPTTPEDLQALADALLDKSSSDEEDEHDEDDKYSKTPDPEDWDALPEAEKLMHKQAIEKRRIRRHNEAVAKLPVYYPGLKGCQHIAEYAILNTIAEGTYGEVFRGKNTRTDEIVALKRFKMEKEKEGFPITALREINMLLKAGSHENIVNVKEILVGSTKTEVYMAMEYVEHDMKSLIDKMRERNQRFRTGQQKTLMKQLLSGIEHMHKLWILHRDLKTSNLLISHSGILKIADFGLAREFGETTNLETRMKLTPVVVTLWYRSPELLLEPKTYSTPVDMWSIGCIMGEFILMNPLLRGNTEPNQVDLIFQMMGTPTETSWPEVKELKIWNLMEFTKIKPGQLKKVFRGEKLLNETGFNLLNGLLTLNPKNRLNATHALNHDWFNEHPLPVPPEYLPTYPAKSELNAAPPKQKRTNRLEALLAEEDPERAALLRQFNVRAEQVKPSGFQLKF